MPVRSTTFTLRNIIGAKFGAVRIVPEFIILFVSLLAGTSRADIIFSQPQSPTGVVYKSSWLPPDGWDGDEYAWEAYTVGSGPATITEIQWQGAYNTLDFTIRLNLTYTTMPDAPSLARYQISGTAGATPAGVINGVQRYTYRYVLPTPLQLAANSTYMINIEGDGGWSIAEGSGGDGWHVVYLGQYPFNRGGDLAITLLGSGPPAINLHPAPITTCSTTAVSFATASPSAGPLTYQWKKDGVNLVNDGRINGAQSPTLQISSSLALDAGSYACSVTNAIGTTTSRAAALLVDVAPQVLSFGQPSPWTGCDGATVTMNASAGAGTPLTLQWRRNGVPISGATTSPYYFRASPATAGMYDCVFTTISCGVSTATNAVRVTVNSPMTITQQPVPASACIGGPASFTVAVTSDTPATYTWRFNGVAISAAANPSSRTATLLMNSVIAADFGSYDCIVTGSCLSRTTSPATLSAGSAPTILVSPAPATVCASGQAMFAVTPAGSGPFTYQWQWQPAGATTAWVNLVAGDNAEAGGMPIVNTANISAATLQARPLAGYINFAPRSFRCIVASSGGGCGSVTSNEATLTVCPADFNCDSFVDFNDYLDFVDALSISSSAADFNGDTLIDFNDYLDFVDAFSVGC